MFIAHLTTTSRYLSLTMNEWANACWVVVSKPIIEGLNKTLQFYYRSGFKTEEPRWESVNTPRRDLADQHTTHTRRPAVVNLSLQKKFERERSEYKDDCKVLKKFLIGDVFLFHWNRARRRKKIAKAIERQARKLRAKGITVDLEALKAEYLSQHRGQNTSNSSESEDNEEEDPIDVVGGADDSDDEDTEDCSTHTRRDSTDHLINFSSSGDDTSKHSLRPNPFSIESLLYRSTWKWRNN